MFHMKEKLIAINMLENLLHSLDKVKGKVCCICYILIGPYIM